MRIRRAGPADVAAITEIWNHYIRETDVTFATEEKTQVQVAALLAARASDGFQTFVCDKGARITGFAGYGQFRAGAGYGRTLENSVMLVPGESGRGQGRALMTAVLEHARTRGAHTMIAGISSANPGALVFHAALGFREAAVLPEAGWKNGRWFDLHLMRYWFDP